MKIQMKRLSMMLTLAMVLVASGLGASAQHRGSGFGAAASNARIVSLPASGRKVAADLNPQPLPPCEKCANTPVIKPGGDPTNRARSRFQGLVH